LSANRTGDGILEERLITTTLIFAQKVHLSLECSMWLDRTRLCKHLAPLDVLAFDTAKQYTTILTRRSLFQQFAKHFDSCTGGLGRVFDTDELDFFLDLNDAALDLTGYDSAPPGNAEDVLDWQEEWLVKDRDWLRDVAV